MPTHLTQFCELFDSSVRPVLEPLDRAITGLRGAPAEVTAGAVTGQLEELCHQLRALADKVREQQGYVLIFGPLKSGKSTLMNAIAGAYVSEVSSLPAYPCLVFVHHGEAQRYEVTRYDGGTEAFGEAAALRTCIEDAHDRLGGAIARVEEAGEAFDPQQHLPDAIRRVDVQMPAESLRRNGAVLVDTPGLYTRMRFGYDRMTRDFRNAAACAVFVVKSDTLFLEQVFAEFNQLLALFSRVFLVVNVDATKRDVGPRGELEPSLEQSSPERIIDAFERLAMPAPLRQAARDGRVRIYPVDLMHAAAAVLKGGGVPVPPAFATFRTELSEYLASDEYLAAFVRDSLQRARGLLAEGEELLAAGGLDRLRGDVAAVERELASLRAQLDRVEACVGRDWGPAFDSYRAALKEAVERRARDEGLKTASVLGASVDTWFLSSHSFRWLSETQWAPLLKGYFQQVHQVAEDVHSQSCAGRRAGLDLDAETAEVLQAVGVDAYAVRSSALAALPPPRPPRRLAPPVEYDSIPVRRGLWEVVTLCSAARLRERLLGPAASPDVKITAKKKAQHLGDAAKQYMRDALHRHRKALVEAAIEATMARYGDELPRGTGGAIVARLREAMPALRDAIAAREALLARLRGVLSPLEGLAAAFDETAGRIDLVARQHRQALERSVADEDGVVLQPQKKEPARRTTGKRRRTRRQNERGG